MSAMERVLEAARRRSRELLDQASAYEHKYHSPETAKETFDEHYKPLKEAIDAVEADALTAAEIDALLWAVRSVSLDVLKIALVTGRFGDGAGYGALSSATNKIERTLERLINEEETSS